MIEARISNTSLDRLVKTLTNRAAVRAYSVAQSAAQQMEEEVVDIVRFYFVNDRPPERRKKGATKLINSFRGRVDGTRGQLPVHAVLGIKPGVNEKKIAALEYGSPAHFIVGTPWLSFPRDFLEGGTLGTEAELQRGRRVRSAYGNPRSKRKFATQGLIFHVGNAEYGMMRQARARTIARLRNG